MELDFSIGDQIVCRVLFGEVVGNKSKNYDFEQVFEIVLSDFEGGYLVYIPDALAIKDSIHITENNCNWYNLHKKFLNSYVIHILERQIVRLHNKMNGMCCEKCNEWFEYASPPDGEDKKFYCFLCRNYRFR